jgi:phosphatidylinositol 4-kinase type 2
VKRGLELGLAPSLSLEGTGGTYFLTDTRKRKLAAFKPQDEEPFAPNNPRGFVGMGSDQVIYNVNAYVDM